MTDHQGQIVGPITTASLTSDAVNVIDDDNFAAALMVQIQICVALIEMVRKQSWPSNDYLVLTGF